MNTSVDIRNYSELEKTLSLADYTVYKRYLSELEHYPIIKATEELLNQEAQEHLRFICLEEFTCRKGEDILQKLSTVYHASMALGTSIIVMVDVPSIHSPAKIYLGVRSDYVENQSTILGTSFQALKNGIKSNFPGSKITDIASRSELPELIKDIFGETNKNISSVSVVASTRDKSGTEEKKFIQGIEKLIDAMQGQTYTAVFIAEPISQEELSYIRNGYENISSILSSFEKSVWSYNESESSAVMESLSKGSSDSIMEGSAHTVAHTISKGFNVGLNAGVNHSNSQGTAVANTHTSPTSVARAGQAISAAAGIANMALNVFSTVVPGGGLATGIAKMVLPAVFGAAGSAMSGGSTSQSLINSTMKTIGQSLGISGGINRGTADTDSNTGSSSKTRTESETKTSGKTDTIGKGRTLQIEKYNKSIGELLKKIDEHLKRVQEGEDYGAYNCGAYFLSGKQESSLLAANIYRALMTGDGSSVERGTVNTWDGTKDKEVVQEIKKYLSKFTHPIFAIPIEHPQDNGCLFYNPGNIVSGLELPLHLGLPNKSVYGLPVYEYAEFGRNIVYRDNIEKNELLDNEIEVGKIYHMRNVQEKSLLNLNIQHLSSHTFITGSTGSGKSNTIYIMLEQLRKQGVNFLVIEPAKGEYKYNIGNLKDVNIYGTNPSIFDMDMLKVNPFRFPSHIHILEHLDRLIDIFNVCWPMYAAMPAILKEAIERAYEQSGWDLILSRNKHNEDIFPTFSDVSLQIKNILDESNYSLENKGNYIGALVTRLKSLTNGINGVIFSSDDIPDSKLFDENTIVDLSRIGSSETKSMIMGILVLKLQEYRMRNTNYNSNLKHITVLEEAHNLLRRTSFEQVSEGSNLQGKSVEMLSNAIAEMRTYGEGFIIADQSPGLLDMSVIRNTNTKIILRLPDFSDRELVGKAAGLNDDQIIEIGRLEKGVAAIFQSDWLEPVLCKVDKFEQNHSSNRKKFIVNNKDIKVSSNKNADVIHMILDMIIKGSILQLNNRNFKEMRSNILTSNMPGTVKSDLLDCMQARDKKELEIKFHKLVYDFFDAKYAIDLAVSYDELEKWCGKVISCLNPSIQRNDEKEKLFVLHHILEEQKLINNLYHNIYDEFQKKYGKEIR